MARRLFHRITTLLAADAHGVVESLEERSLLLKQYLREAERALDDTRARLEAVRDDARRLAQEIAHHEREIATLDEDVGLALGAGKDDLARFAIRRLLPHRRALAARYQAGLADLPLALPVEAPGARHVYHLYVVRAPERDRLAAFLRARGIATGIHYPVPAHRQPAIELVDLPVLPHTERLVGEILSLPISAGHTEEEIDTVIAAIQEFYRAG